MKKQIVKFSLMLTLLAGFSAAANAQHIYVRVQPAAPVVTRPAAPSARHIWIDGEWIVRNNNYEWKPGYWSIPPERSRWVHGYWVKERGGWYWHPGYWRKY